MIFSKMLRTLLYVSLFCVSSPLLCMGTPTNNVVDVFLELERLARAEQQVPDPDIWFNEDFLINATFPSFNDYNNYNAIPITPKTSTTPTPPQTPKPPRKKKGTGTLNCQYACGKRYTFATNRTRHEKTCYTKNQLLCSLCNQVLLNYSILQHTNSIYHTQKALKNAPRENQKLFIPITQAMARKLKNQKK